MRMGALKNQDLKYSNTGYFFLLLFSFLSFSDISPALERISLFALLCLAIANLKRFSFTRINPILLSTFIWFIYVWLNTLLHLAEKDYLAITDTATFLDRAKDWSLIAFFPIVSLFLNSDGRRGNLFLFAGLGLFFSIGISFKDINLIGFFDVDARYGFKHSINHFALFIGTTLIGAIVFGSQTLVKSQRYLFILSVVVASLSTLLLIKTQTRMAWIAILLVILFIFLISYFFNNAKGIKRPEIASTIFILLPCILVIIFLNPVIEKRLNTKESVIRHNVASTDHSINSRVELLKFGYSKWLEKPIFGHGPLPSRILVSELGNTYISERAHLHNTYLEVMVSWGIVGLLLCGITISLLLKTVFFILLKNNNSSIYCLFFLSSMLYWLLWSAAEFNVYRGAGQYYWLILAGLGYSIYQQNTE